MKNNEKSPKYENSNFSLKKNNTLFFANLKIPDILVLGNNTSNYLYRRIFSK